MVQITGLKFMQFVNAQGMKNTLQGVWHEHYGLVRAPPMIIG